MSVAPNPHILSPSTVFDLVKSLKLSDRGRLITHDAQLRAELAAAEARLEDLAAVAPPEPSDNTPQIVAWLRRLGGEGKTVRAAQIVRIADLLEAGAHLETP